MLRAAVQDNADIIAGRLPVTLRPGRRVLAVWGLRVWLLPVPFSIIIALTLVAYRSAAAVHQVPMPPAAPESLLPEPVLAGVPSAPPDLSLLTRPLRASALGLGVRRVILDPGHGGEHFGTESASGLLEKDVTLDLANRARRLLVSLGYEVQLTRTADVSMSLKERATAANEGRGDIFVSIHLNSFAPSSVRGIETYYLGPSDHPAHDAIAEAENQHSGYSLADMRTLLDGIYVHARRDESRRLARAVQDAMVQRLTRDDPGISDRGVKSAPFVVLVATDMPAILAEVSCLSNPEEARRLETDAYRQTIAEALVTGIKAFIDQKPRLTAERKDINER